MKTLSRKLLCALFCAFVLTLAAPAYASVEEATEHAEEMHESVLRKVFVWVGDAIRDEEQEEELRKWESENAYGVGVRG